MVKKLKKISKFTDFKDNKIYEDRHSFGETIFLNFGNDKIILIQFGIL